jgi:hypothetical protein
MDSCRRAHICQRHKFHTFLINAQASARAKSLLSATGVRASGECATSTRVSPVDNLHMRPPRTQAILNRRARLRRPRQAETARAR